MPIVGCANEQASQPFASWGDSSSYTLIPGGNFEAGAFPWALTGGAKVLAGNETYHVGGPADSQSLSLPAGSSATSPFGSQVTIVQLSTTSPLAGSRQPSYRPAKPIASPSLRRIRNGRVGPRPSRFPS